MQHQSLSIPHGHHHPQEQQLSSSSSSFDHQGPFPYHLSHKLLTAKQLLHVGINGMWSTPSPWTTLAESAHWMHTRATVHTWQKIHQAGCISTSMTLGVVQPKGFGLRIFRVWVLSMNLNFKNFPCGRQNWCAWSWETKAFITLAYQCIGTSCSLLYVCTLRVLESHQYSTYKNGNLFHGYVVLGFWPLAWFADLLCCLSELSDTAADVNNNWNTTQKICTVRSRAA